jgi:hypothetical protein
MSPLAPTMVRDAVTQVAASYDEHVELREVLHDFADERGQINRGRLGWWIKRHAGRIVDGKRFVRDPSNRSAVAWQVESVSPVSQGSVVPSDRSVCARVGEREIVESF